MISLEKRAIKSFLSRCRFLFLGEQAFLFLGSLISIYGLVTLLGWAGSLLIAYGFRWDGSSFSFVTLRLVESISLLIFVWFFRKTLLRVSAQFNLLAIASQIETQVDCKGEIVSAADFLSVPYHHSPQMEHRFFAMLVPLTQRISLWRLVHAKKMVRLVVSFLVIISLYALTSMVSSSFTPFDFLSKGYAEVPHRIDWDAFTDPLYYRLDNPSIVVYGEDFPLSIESNAKGMEVVVRMGNLEKSYSLEVSPFILQHPESDFMFQVRLSKRHRNDTIELKQSEWIPVQIHHPPRLDAIRVTYTYPKPYDSKQVIQEDHGNIAALAHARIHLEGFSFSRLDRAILQFGSQKDIINLPVESFEVDSVPNAPDKKFPTDVLTYSPHSLESCTVSRFNFDFTLTKSDTYTLTFWDELGYQNPDELEYSITVLPDSKPHVRIVLPGENILWEEDQPLSIVVEADDDYGIQSLRLVGSKKGSKRKSVTVLNHRFSIEGESYDREEWRSSLEPLGIKAGETFEYYAVVADGIGQMDRSKTYTVTWKAVESIVEKETAEKSDVIKNLLREQEDIQNDLMRVSESMAANQANPDHSKILEDLQHREKKVAEVLQDAIQDLESMEDQVQKSSMPISDAIIQKSQEIRELMEDIVDDQTRDMLRQIDKALQFALQKHEANQPFQSKPLDKEGYLKQLEKILEELKILQQLKVISEAEQALQKARSAQDRLHSRLEKKEKRVQEDMNEVTFQLDKFQRMLQNKQTDDISRQMNEVSQSAQNLQDAPLKQLKKGLEDANYSQMMESSHSLKQGLDDLSVQVHSLLDSIKNRNENQLNQFFNEWIDELQSINRSETETYQRLQEYKKQSYLKGILPDADANRMMEQSAKHQQHIKRRMDEFKQLAERHIKDTPTLLENFSKGLQVMEETSDTLNQRSLFQSEKAQEETLRSLNQLTMQMIKKQQEFQKQQNEQKSQCSKPGSFSDLAQAQSSLNQSIQEMWKQMGEGKSLSPQEEEYLNSLADQQRSIREGLKEGNSSASKPQQEASAESTGEEGSSEGSSTGGSDPSASSKAKEASAMDREEGDGSAGTTGAQTLQQAMERSETLLRLKKINEELVQTQIKILDRLLQYSKGIKEGAEKEEKRKAHSAKSDIKDKDNQWLLQKELERFLADQRLKEPAYLPSLTPEENQRIRDYFNRLRNMR